MNDHPIEGRLRDALAARAEAFSASPDAWEHVQAKARGERLPGRRRGRSGPPGTGWLARHTGFVVPAAAAVAVAAVVLSATMLAHGPSGTTRTSPSPSPLTGGLESVSCVSANFCAAVGSLSPSPPVYEVPVTMIWNGARWRRTAINLPKDWPTVGFSAVSCVSAAYCVAVGNYIKRYSPVRAVAVPVAATWNGTAWTARALPSLAGGAPVRASISCAAAGRCVVGFAANPMPTSKKMFIDVQNGAKWTVHALTPPKGSDFAAISAVSCVSVTHCVIAGVAQSQPGGETPLFATWNGKALSTMKTPARFSTDFHGLSCASATSCMAIGQLFSGPDFDYGIWDGSIWKGAVQTLPKAIVDSYPVAVSCAVPTTCIMVGYYRNSAPVKGDYPNHALAEVFNGTSWTRLSVPAPAGANDTDFSAISCLSATRCVAVGTTTYGSPPKYSDTPLTAFWNGTSWRLVPAP